MQNSFSYTCKNFQLMGITLLISLGIAGCNGSTSLYEAKIVQKVKSPEGDMVAVVYEGSGGATGANSSGVNIFESSEILATKSEEIPEKGLVFFTKENPEINLNWKNYNELEIEHSGEKEWVRGHRDHYLGVTIKFKQIENKEKTESLTNEESN